MDHVGIVVDDLGATIEFSEEMGLAVLGEWTGGGRSLDRIVGLEDAGRTSR
jgi:hypothetical protein